MPTRRTSRPKARFALGTLAAVLALSACGDDEAATTEGGIELVEAGQLTVCTSLPYEPFQFQQDGEIVGFDVKLGDEIAAELGVEQQIIDTPFEGIQSGEALNAGQCDLAAAGMTITEVREENLDFSDPYFEATQALIAPAGSGLDSFEALQGMRLAIQAGTTGAQYATENGEGVELVTYEDLGLLLAAVETGQVDAGINDNGVLLDFVQNNEEFEVTTEFDTGEQYGIGVATGNTELLEVVNEVLAEVQESGRYDEIYEEWFGTAPTS